MKLKKEFVDGILAHSFDEPSISQQQSIPTILAEKDAICQAEFGIHPALNLEQKFEISSVYFILESCHQLLQQLFLILTQFQESKYCNQLQPNIRIRQ
ncbi:Eukaryotic_translation initiation factor 4A [Hexamita inflata]|uniref:Eukaryotic translation initiation factor 4A n=1 Tax=Hexamita inflata TaxID=28002 RepID=A0AA86RGZ7_9EUKA|nr:Eukaryotic translation initiation factor 4A [Hexamita inflata]